MPNRLIHEKSLYLKQHANNPVDWYPWGTEALEKAKKENKPILLSIGYSACHWCHVMEHESFENPDIARLMNENFVSIKVDREERPDLDQIYQNVAQLMTHSGGWPLTVFLTPELKPFFGGTYFPPQDRYGRPGFPKVLQALSDAYRNQPEAISENTEKLFKAMEKLESTSFEVQESGKRKPDQEFLKKIAHDLLENIDWKNGGFGRAPKFPNTMNLTYLWRFGVLTDFGQALDAVILSLKKMASGGIYDQLGGGFHRYSVDATWSVPHFEKMLYDNALLLKLYSEVLLNAPNELMSESDRTLFTRVVGETVEYVLREMTSPEGSFYATQDADSEGHEGKFFVWDLNDLKDILTPEEVEVFSKHYGVTEQGNFEGTPKTVLFLNDSSDNTPDILARAKEKVFQVRGNRIAPARDEKMITGWNALMVSGLSWAVLVLRRQESSSELSTRAEKAARKAFEHISAHGERLPALLNDERFTGYLDDYAFSAMAALDLARITTDSQEQESCITSARKWVNTIRTKFKDPDAPGYFFTANDHEKLLLRPKTLYDQAIPSGTAVTLQALSIFSELEADSSLQSLFEEELFSLSPLLEQNPFGMGELSSTCLLYTVGPALVSIPSVQNLRASDSDIFSNPFIFRKPTANENKEILFCHRQTCQKVEGLPELRRLSENRK